jgi:hypothetical protein
MMQWKTVDSTSVAAIGYDPGKRELAIRFRESGEVYFYFDVPSEEHQSFLAAESKGNYLNRVLKPKGYRYSGPHPNPDPKRDTA